MRFGRDFEFDVVDLTLKHSMIGFVTLLVLKFSQSFVVVVYVVFVVVVVVVLVYFAILIMWSSIMLMSMSNFLRNIDSQAGPKGCGCGICLNC